MSKKMWRQGDVLVVEGAPKQLGETMARENGAVVLAHGEATGHTHALRGVGATMYMDTGAGTGLAVKEAQLLVHEEHTPIPLDIGDYTVVRQVEWTSEHQVRQVAD